MTISSSFVGFNCLDLFENIFLHFHQLLIDFRAVRPCAEEHVQYLGSIKVIGKG